MRADRRRLQHMACDGGWAFLLRTLLPMLQLRRRQAGQWAEARPRVWQRRSWPALLRERARAAPADRTSLLRWDSCKTVCNMTGEVHVQACCPKLV